MRIRTGKRLFAEWKDSYVDDQGFPLCAVLKPAYIMHSETSEMSDAEYQEAFQIAEWPFEECSSWATEEEA